MSAAEPWPTEIRLRRSARTLRCAFDDGAVVEIPFDRLRAMTPSAEARGHGGDPDAPLPGDFSAVDVLEVAPVGAYAVRLVFSDGHASGLYTWDRLRRLGEAVSAPSA